jgi:hypothetical protein
MPLLDHFHPPLSKYRPWDSFRSTWASTIADLLNRHVLPAGFIALEYLHTGAAVEIDVEAVRPPTAPVILAASFPPSATVEIHATEGGRTLVGAIELVSPGNKDRPGKRRLLAAKCATYLSRGIGLILLDVVTSRQANLHNELLNLMEWQAPFAMPADVHLYAVAYRPLQEEGKGRIECWPTQLSLGDRLPCMPLSLQADLCLEVDLEAAYAEACQRRRIDEVVPNGE